MNPNLGVSAEPAQSLSHLRVNGERLWNSLTELGKVGAYFDEDTQLEGVRRLALTDEDMAGRELVLGWMREAGLQITMDSIGNVYARREGTDPTASPIMVGSHIDSVATAGRFDGCLGVLGGLEVVRVLNDANAQTTRSIVVAIFTEEEGSRFGTDMLGSAVAAGRIALEEAYARTDREGVTVKDEIDRHGLQGEESVPIPPPHVYLECHIEQGPVLSQRNVEVGVVTGVQAINWKEVRIRGRAAHAGTTPYRLRRNAGLAASLLAVGLNEMVESDEYGELLANVGRIEVKPNLINIVPAHALMTVDLRNTSDHHMRRAEEAFTTLVADVEKRCGVEMTVETTAQTDAVDFPQHMQDLVAKSAANLGLSNVEIMSGAGHDAGELAAVSPTGMVFVPGRYDGISHNPREYSTPEACEDGTNVLLQTVVRLTE